MNPTPNQITECADEKQLCEWAAIYCNGWSISYTNNSLNERKPVYSKKSYPLSIISVDDYQPTSPTEKGKAQCWDLAANHHCWPRLRNGKHVVFVDDNTEVEHENPQIAAVKAAIIAALNGEEL